MQNISQVMPRFVKGQLICLLAITLVCDGRSRAQEFPDIRSVTADLEMPTMVDVKASRGLRVKRYIKGQVNKAVYHSLYLPRDWNAMQKWPILVELPGNGGYRDKLDDACSGRPEDACLGYGISAGEGFLWICCPFLNSKGDDISIKWWGDSPTFDTRSSIEYLNAAIDDTCENFGGDPSRIILCGFSRGALACNYLGLHDDEVAKRWQAFVVYSHYDGVRKWPYPNSDRESAAQRLLRLKDRPQFICGEGNQSSEAENYLKPLIDTKNLTFASTGFRNHNDRWTLRPSPAREQLRTWLSKLVAE